MSQPAIYLGIQEITSAYTVTVAYARKLACEHQWRRYRHPDKGVRYRADDVDQTLNRGADRRRQQRRVKSQTDPR